MLPVLQCVSERYWIAPGAPLYQNLNFIYESQPMIVPTRICSLKPNVTREQAIEQLTATGATRLLRTLTAGPLRSVAELYVPFRLYRAHISNRGRLDESLVAIDAVAGTLDLFRFDHVPSDEETIALDTRNHVATALPETLARERLIAKLRRVAYQRGFFRLQDLAITAEAVSDLYIPYWLGFRGSNGRARVTVLDAVRRRLEGAKMRRLVENWLLSNSPSE